MVFLYIEVKRWITNYYKISSKIGFEISRVNSKKISWLSNHKTEILQSFRNVNTDQEDHSRYEGTEEKKLEELFPEGRMYAESGDGPPRELLIYQYSFPLAVALFFDRHQSTPTALANKSSSVD